MEQIRLLDDGVPNAFPWQNAPEISKLEFKAWEALRMLIHAGIAAGCIEAARRDVFLILLAEMFQAGMRAPSDLGWARLSIVGQDVGEA
jgi:hypothetical protein